MREPVREQVHVEKVTMVCLACPSLWEGTTSDGQAVVAKYRFGRLRVTVAGEPVYRQQLGDELDGLMEYADLVRHTKGVVSWPEDEPPEPDDSELYL